MNNEPTRIYCDGMYYTYAAGSIHKGIITGLGPRGGEHAFVRNRPSGRWLRLSGNMRRPREFMIAELRVEGPDGAILETYRAPTVATTPADRLAATYNKSRTDAGICTICGGVMNCASTGQYIERKCINFCTVERESLSALTSYTVRHGMCSKATSLQKERTENDRRTKLPD